MNHLSEDHLRRTREQLLARGNELHERLERVKRDLRREREPLPGDSNEAAIAVENDEVLQALEQSAAREIRLVERALERLEQGVFALCEKCGAEIEAQRLKAVPYATTCHACARDS